MKCVLKFGKKKDGVWTKCVIEFGQKNKKTKTKKIFRPLSESLTRFTTMSPTLAATAITDRGTCRLGGTTVSCLFMIR